MEESVASASALVTLKGVFSDCDLTLIVARDRRPSYLWSSGCRVGRYLRAYYFNELAVGLSDIGLSAIASR